VRRARFGVLVQELMDEILEAQARLDRLLGIQSTPATMSGIASQISSLGSTLVNKQDEIRQLQRHIEYLKRLKERAEKDQTNLKPVILDSLQTMSIQVHRDKQPVRALGHAYPKGFTQGGRLIAGSMIFTLFREHPLARLIDTINLQGIQELRQGLGGFHQAKFANVARSSFELIPSSGLADQLPPLHVTATAVNEAGNAATMTIYGLRFLNDGMVMSIQDMLTENTLSFVAQDIDIMRTLDTRGVDNIPALDRQVTVSSFMTSPAALARRQRRGLPF